MSDYPIVGAFYSISTIFLSFGVVLAIALGGVFSYIGLWAADMSGAFDLGFSEKLVFLEWTRWPISLLEKIIAAYKQRGMFEPEDRLQIWLFNFIITPFIYLFTTEVSVVTVFVVPVLATFYLMDSSFFVDEEKELEDGTPMPRVGLPQAFLEYYELNALSWGNYQYLYGHNESGMNFWKFITLELWALL